MSARRIGIGPVEIGAAFVMMMMMWVATAKYGPGLTPDSTFYIALSTHIASGSGFLELNNQPTATWPPLYPALLALLQWLFGIEPLVAARVMCIVTSGLIVLGAALLLHRQVSGSRPLYLFGLASVVVSFPLASVGVMAWSEPLFILLVIAFLGTVEKYRETCTWSLVFLLAALAAFATLTRYIGITLIATGGLALLFYQNGQLSFSGRLWRSCLFGVIASIPLTAWLVRNLVVTNTLLGSRSTSNRLLVANLSLTAHTVLHWFAPNVLLRSPGYWLLGGGVIGYIVALTSRGVASGLGATLRRVSHHVLFVFVYTFFLLVSSTTTAYDAIDDRLLSPIFVPMLVVCLSLAETWWIGTQNERAVPRIVGKLLPLIAVLLLLYPFLVAVVHTRDAWQKGVGGYSTQMWHDADIVRYLRENPMPQGIPIYSNAPDGLYVLTGIQASLSPTRQAITQTDNEPLPVETPWPDSQTAYLIWMDAKRRPYLSTVQELHANAEFSSVIEFDDGAVYRVSPLSPSP